MTAAAITPHPSQPPIPNRMKRLPLDHRGFVVPWFVHWNADHAPDFRVIGKGKMHHAIRANLCWLCGQVLGRHKAFVIGPMCAINRVSGEPPCHLDCATFAVQACPFLTRPRMRRNEKTELPEDSFFSPTGISRNPGVALVWVTDHYDRFLGNGNEILFRIGAPSRLGWFCEGRPATRREVLDSIESGYPALRAQAGLQVDALEALDRMTSRRRRCAPAAPTA